MNDATTRSEAEAMGARVRALIERTRLPLTDEKVLQEELAAVLARAGIEHEREVRLSGSDIPDFMIGGLAVEVKIKGQKTAIFRQLGRYAAHDRVQALLLVSRVAMGLPETICGKPAALASLGRGWL